MSKLDAGYDGGVSSGSGTYVTRLAGTTGTPAPVPIYNVKDYGAAGDGVTDDYTAIKNALNAALSGGIVFLPAGTYIIGTAIDQGGSNWTLCGVGPASVLKMKNAGNLDRVLLTDGASHIVVRDFKIDANRANQTAGLQRGIDVYNTTDSVFSVDVVNTGGEAIYASGAGDLRTVIERCNINGCWRGISTGGINKLTVRNNVVVNSGESGASIWAQNGSEINVCDNTVVGGSVRQIVLNACSYSTVTGNICDGAADDGISIETSTVCTVTGNTLKGSGSGTNVGPGISVWAGSTFVTVTGNAVSGFEYGIVMDGSTAGSNADCVIAENTCTACVDGIRCDAGGGFTNDRVLIRGNVCGSNSAYGIHLLGATSHCIVEGNYLNGNTTAPFLDASTGSGHVTRNNPGYNPRGHAVAQPAVPATTVAATNTTQCDCTVFVSGGTVTAVAIGGTATGLTSGAFRVLAGQTITLTYSVAPTWQWFGD